MSNRLENKVVLVLGAGSIGPGIGNGKAAAIAYAREGAKVWAADLDIERAEETKHIIKSEGGSCVARAVDVSSSDQIEDLIDYIIGESKKIDILHNNVGISCFGGPIELSEADWDRSIDCNLKSVFLSCKHALPHMLKQSSGVITNISSILSVRISGYDQIAYYASKAGVNQLTKAIAVKYAADGIRANAILPGLIDTPLLYANEDVAASHGGVNKMVEARNAMSPTGKMGEAWDVAGAAVFLASDEAKYINGELLTVDGGLTCKQA